MGLFGKRKKPAVKYRDTEIVAVGTGTMVPPSEISDAVFAEEMLGQTIGFNLTDGTVVAPANGILDVMFPTGHAFAVRMKDGTGLLVHIGIGTVEMNGSGFKTMAKQGDRVYAGQTIVQVDLDAVKKAGCDAVTMLILSEPKEEGQHLTYTDYGPVTKGQVICSS